MTDQHNGQSQPMPGVSLPAVDLLEKVLAAARQGQFNTIAIVAVEPNGNTQTMFVGPRLGDVGMGLDMVKQRIVLGLMGYTNLDVLKQRGSAIMRVPGMALGG